MLLEQFRIKFKKIFFTLVFIGSLLITFVFDVINWSVSIDSAVLIIARQLIVIIGFTSLYFLIESLWKRDQRSIKKLGFAFVVIMIVALATLVLLLISTAEFDVKNNVLLPLSFYSIVLANIYGIVLGTTSLIILLIIRDIIYMKRRKETRRNFSIFIILILLGSASTLAYKPLEMGPITLSLLVLTILSILFNSFRLTWIVYLSKREKLYSMIYSFLLFCIFVAFDVATSNGVAIGKALLFYSTPLKSFISSISLFATIYFGLTFVSTLFHLPTAEAYDRKITEISSLHNLSRLVTQVFDFNELVDSVTRMTIEVCNAKSSWLEILNLRQTNALSFGRVGKNISESELEIVSHMNITLEDVNAIAAANDGLLRKMILEDHKPIVINEVKKDKRMKHLPTTENKFSSLVVVPMISHESVIGILYVSKDIEFGFDQDDIDVISTFADQATIAVENSRLIEKSLERERLMREMMVAQEMQKKLLPQQVPLLREIELEALSTPAFEVGGDYYDFTMLDEDHLAIVVGDVSGKGVSAAFYMAEMKGIFQSLSKIYKSPKTFLTKAHAALLGTIDRRSFVSVIYAVLDLKSGIMHVARAGHCPLLLISDGKAEYIKQKGLGLGMGTTDFFETAINEVEITLKRNDIAIFYTDGITEAHQKEEKEFGYERLLDVARSLNNKSVIEIRDTIITSVDKHMNHEPPADDITLLILKWIKN